MLSIFTRAKQNPILKPNPSHPWEALKVYNPGAIYHAGKYHLFYRATGVGINWHSSIGYAISSNGINFKRQTKYLLTPEYSYEKKGCEDPRITKVKETFYLTYTAFDGLTAKLALATSKNLRQWTKHGPILKNWNFKYSHNFLIKWDMALDDPEEDKNWSKAGSIFPEIINGKFYMLFGDRHIWLATSSDGLNWSPINRPFLIHKNSKSFSAAHLEMGPPPLKTKHGWLALYHGIDNKAVYRLGFVLLDLNNPEKILYRSKQPIFEPSAPYELDKKIDLSGDKTPQVTFVNGATLEKSKLRIFYGAGDQTVCTAVCNLNKLLKII